jgi:hypothetical protein
MLNNRLIYYFIKGLSRLTFHIHDIPAPDESKCKATGYTQPTLPRGVTLRRFQQGPKLQSTSLSTPP